MNQIKHRDTGAVLYEYDSGVTLHDALERATTKNANLSGANLYGADLSGSNLYGANLYGANLYGADLSGSNLYGANLYGANLRGADLSGADLSGVDLSGVDLGEHGKLVGERPFFQFGPIGSRSDYLLSFITDKGIVIKAGCFTGTLDEFRAAVEKTHGENDHGNEYAMAMRMVEAHASLWMPKEATK